MSDNIPMCPSAEWYVKRDLEELKQEKWGWVIYRTGYTDNIVWSKFKDILARHTAFLVGDSDYPEIINSVDWVFMDDRDTFDQASHDFLRQHFNAWADAAVVSENPRADAEGLDRLSSNRYCMFVEVNDECMRDITEAFDEKYGVEAGIPGEVHLIDAYWKPRGLDLEGGDEGAEEINGCKEENVGWMVIKAFHLGAGLYTEIHGSWYTFYVRPPEVLNW